MLLRQSFFLFFLAASLTPDAVHAQRQLLTVVVKNVRDGKGNIAVALYDSEKNFMKTIWKGQTTPARKGEVQIAFEGIPAGTWALSVMHDANENGKLDSNFMGIPKEGFGFSNDAAGSFGPPSFKDAKFDVSGRDQTVIINLKYF